MDLALDRQGESYLTVRPPIHYSHTSLATITAMETRSLQGAGQNGDPTLNLLYHNSVSLHCLQDDLSDLFLFFSVKLIS